MKPESERQAEKKEEPEVDLKQADEDEVNYDGGILPLRSEIEF